MQRITLLTLKNIVTGLGCLLLPGLFVSVCVGQAPAGFDTLFDGKSLAGWVVPEGDNGHWKVVDGVIDYDAASEAKGDKNLWTEKEYGDFVLMLDWRLKKTTGHYNVPVVLSNGTHLKDATGKDITIPLPNADSGIYLRGQSRSQVNIWCWPIGSGEVYSYRMNKKLPPAVRAGVTPRVNADKPVGQWNHLKLFCNRNRISVTVNGKQVSRMDTDQFSQPNKRPDGSTHKFPVVYKDHPRLGYIGLQDHGADTWKSLTAADLMTADPITIGAEVLVVKALEQMEHNRRKPISVLPVVNQEHQLMGLLRLHDLVQAGLA